MLLTSLPWAQGVGRILVSPQRYFCQKFTLKNPTEQKQQQNKTPELEGRLKRETDKIKEEISLFTLFRRKSEFCVNRA